MAIEKVHKGDGRESDFNPFGLDDLKDNPEIGPQGTMFGDKTNSKDNPDIHVFIVTPRPRVTQTKETEKGLIWRPNSERNDPNANAGKQPLYKEHVDKVQSDLRNTFGSDVPIKVVTYAPRMMSVAQSIKLYNAERGPEGARDEVIDEINNRLIDNEQKNPRGKILIQYRPAGDCHEKSAWRLWAESQERALVEWDPLPYQHFEIVHYSDDDDSGDDDEMDVDDNIGEQIDLGSGDAGEPMDIDDGDTGPKTDKGPKTDTEPKTDTGPNTKIVKRKRKKTCPNKASNGKGSHKKCEKDADCNGPDFKCNKDKKGVCNKNKKCQCRKTSKSPQKTTKTAANPTATGSQTKCEKDSDCSGPDFKCNNDKKGICNKNKKCQCQKTSKSSPNTTTAPQKTTSRKKGDATSTAVSSNPSIKCEKDSDCDASDLRCNSGKKGVCNKNKKCMCQIIPETKSSPKNREKGKTTMTKTTKDSPKSTKTTKPGPGLSMTPLKLGPQKCHDEDDFPDHGDIYGPDVKFKTRIPCKDSKQMGPGDSVDDVAPGSPGHSDIHFNVRWIDGCRTESKTQSKLGPLGSTDAFDWSSMNNQCEKLLLTNWENCK